MQIHRDLTPKTPRVNSLPAGSYCLLKVVHALKPSLHVPRIFLLISIATSAYPAEPDSAINGLLEPICQKYHLPAMAGAIVTSQGLVAAGAVGLRKAGTDVAVTVDDEWHLGSDTKAMTAVVIATLVQQQKLTWDITIEQVFPTVAPSLPRELRKTTLIQLLSHRAGLPHDANWRNVSHGGSLHEQRVAALASMASTPLHSIPGSTYSYSNLGYVIAAAMAEEVTGESWEHLIVQIVFKPLDMETAGFGGMGTPGKIDQPWQHSADGRPVPRNGPAADNLPVMGPAGAVHCSIADWAKFIADQLRGLESKPALLLPETYQTIHRPPFGGTYAFGWMVLERPWGGGTVFTHSGSNNTNFAIVWMAPKRDFAVLVCSNQNTPNACHEAASGLIQLHATHFSKLD